MVYLFLILAFFKLIDLKTFFKCLFIFEREIDRVEGQRGRERGRQRMQSRLCADSREPDAGLELTNPEIVT